MAENFHPSILDVLTVPDAKDRKIESLMRDLAASKDREDDTKRHLADAERRIRELEISGPRHRPIFESDIRDPIDIRDPTLGSMATPGEDCDALAVRLESMRARQDANSKFNAERALENLRYNHSGPGPVLDLRQLSSTIPSRAFMSGPCVTPTPVRASPRDMSPEY